MKVLFVHPNFPAQFRHVATALGANPKNEVIFLTANPRPEWEIKGVRKEIYKVDKISQQDASPFPELNSRLFAARGVLDGLVKLKKSGIKPDLIVGHSGWGTTLFIKDVYPDVPFYCYFEWYYRLHGSNLDFDPENPPSLNSALNIRLRNSVILNDLEACDSGITPTLWQKKQFPKIYHDKIHCFHDGIDTDFFRPTENKGLTITGVDLSQVKKLVTFTARGLEPYRGFPQFVKALPKILSSDKECHVVVAGEDRVCYGEKRKDGKTYMEHMLETVSFDRDRVHFVGGLPYGEYLRVLQQSTVHVYLTYPFVLSWSLLESMSCGCAVVASDTPPAREVIQDGVNGIMTDFFSPEDIASKVVGILSYPSFTKKMRISARQTIEKKYSLSTLLPHHLQIMENLTTAPESSGPFG